MSPVLLEQGGFNPSLRRRCAPPRVSPTLGVSYVVNEYRLLTIGNLIGRMGSGIILVGGCSVFVADGMEMGVLGGAVPIFGRSCW